MPELGKARRRGGRIAACVVGTTVCLGVAACGGVRPYLTPLPGATVDTLRVEAPVLVRMIGAVLDGEAVRVKIASPDEGYVESDWFDVGTGRPGGAATSHPHRVVRFRFFAEPLSEDRTVLTSEVVYRLTSDPSVPVREREVLAPETHDGFEMLERMRQALRGLYGGGTGG